MCWKFGVVLLLRLREGHAWVVIKDAVGYYYQRHLHGKRPYPAHSVSQRPITIGVKGISYKVSLCPIWHHIQTDFKHVLFNYEDDF